MEKKSIKTNHVGKYLYIRHVGTYFLNLKLNFKHKC